MESWFVGHGGRGRSGKGSSGVASGRRGGGRDLEADGPGFQIRGGATQPCLHEKGFAHRWLRRRMKPLLQAVVVAGAAEADLRLSLKSVLTTAKGDEEDAMLPEKHGQEVLASTSAVLGFLAFIIGQSTSEAYRSKAVETLSRFIEVFNVSALEAVQPEAVARGGYTCRRGGEPCNHVVGVQRALLGKAGPRWGEDARHAPTLLHLLMGRAAERGCKGCCAWASAVLRELGGASERGFREGTWKETPEGFELQKLVRHRRVDPVARAHALVPLARQGAGGASVCTYKPRREANRPSMAGDAARRASAWHAFSAASKFHAQRQLSMAVDCSRPGTRKDLFLAALYERRSRLAVWGVPQERSDSQSNLNAKNCFLHCNISASCIATFVVLWQKCEK